MPPDPERQSAQHLAQLRLGRAIGLEGHMLRQALHRLLLQPVARVGRHPALPTSRCGWLPGVGLLGVLRVAGIRTSSWAHHLALDYALMAVTVPITIPITILRAHWGGDGVGRAGGV